MFSLLTECLEIYYTRKLLSVALNRMDQYVLLKFKGVKSVGISVDNISTLNKEDCTNPPCSHQAAIVMHSYIPAANCVPTLSPESRQRLAGIALGFSSVLSCNFYSSLHQKNDEEVSAHSSHTNKVDNPNFSAAEWDLIRGQASEIDQDDPTTCRDADFDADKIVSDMEQIFADITVRIKDSSVFAQGVEKFIKRNKDMSIQGKFANAALASSLHRFGWVFGGRTKNMQGGFLRRGRRIPVNAKAAGRRRGTLSRGKAKVTPGRPKRACYPGTNTMTTRKPAKGKD